MTGKRKEESGEGRGESRCMVGSGGLGGRSWHQMRERRRGGFVWGYWA